MSGEGPSIFDQFASGLGKGFGEGVAASQEQLNKSDELSNTTENTTKDQSPQTEEKQTTSSGVFESLQGISDTAVENSTEESSGSSQGSKDRNDGLDGLI